MYKMTKKVEYALIALQHLQHLAEDELVATREIAETYSIPQEILAKTLQLMTRLDYIEAIKGAQGGYRLKTSLDVVNLADFIEAMEGPIGMVDCNLKTECSQIKLCNIRLPIKRINDNIHSLFSNIKLSEITCGTPEEK